MLRRTATPLVALTLALTACGGSSSPPKAIVAAANAPEEFGLPLAELAGRIEKTEQLIATCMTTAGFKYVANDFVTINGAMKSDQSAKGVSAEDYVKQFGLGITTQPDKPLVVFGAGPQNMAFLAGLPASDQVAFKRALWGEALDWNHARAVEQEDFSLTKGCTRAAADKLYSPAEVAGGYVNPADKRVAQDPRMIAALKKWSECMRAKGFNFDTPDQVEADLRERLAGITKGQDAKTLSGPALAALGQLQGEERAVATLLTSCEIKHVEPVQDKVEADILGAAPK